MNGINNPFNERVTCGAGHTERRALADKFGKRKILIVALAASTFPIFFFVYCRTFIQTLTVLLTIAVSNAFLMPTCSVLLADIVPKEKRNSFISVLGRGTLMINTQGGGDGGPRIGLLLTIPVILASIISVTFIVLIQPIRGSFSHPA